MNEWQPYKIHIPDDDYDEDDAIDDMIARNEARRRRHTTRGSSMFGTT